MQCTYIIYKPIKKFDMYTVVRMLNDERTFGTFNSIVLAKNKAKEMITDGNELNLLVCEVINGIRKYLFTV